MVDVGCHFVYSGFWCPFSISRVCLRFIHGIVCSMLATTLVLSKLMVWYVAFTCCFSMTYGRQVFNMGKRYHQQYRKGQKKHKIDTVFTAHIKITYILLIAEAKINQENHGVYKIPCRDCDPIYSSQINRRRNVRKDKHQNAIGKEERT